MCAGCRTRRSQCCEDADMGAGGRWRLSAWLAATLVLAQAGSAAGVTLNESSLPTATDPAAIALGPDGAAWFGRTNANQVGRTIAPFGTAPTYVTLTPSSTARARALAAG